MLLFLLLVASCVAHARMLDKVVVYDLHEPSESDARWAALSEAWSLFRPCANGSKKIPLTIYSARSNIFPSNCFSPVHVQPAADLGINLKEQAIFEQEMEASSNMHVLFLSMDCLPIVADWIARVNDLVIEPNAAFWVKSSLSLQGVHSLGTDDAFYHHLIPSGVYFFGTEFKKLYKSMKTFSTRYYTEDAPFSHYFHNYLYDQRVMDTARYHFAKFVVDDFVFASRSRALVRPKEAIFQARSFH